VTLAAPSGWTVTPSGPASVAAIAEGSSASQSWTVTAPASGSGQAALPAALSATASYTSAGQSRQVTASQQAADTPAPPPAPVITSVTPSADPGGPVTITGQNFGATQGGSYLTLVQGGTSWGAPYDGAQVTITSWSDTSITVTLPPGSNVAAATGNGHDHGDGRRPGIRAADPHHHVLTSDGDRGRGPIPAPLSSRHDG
jgi:hypothetical protein